MPEPQWLDRDLVDALHEQSLRLHGGLAGVRDASVLEAAIASPATSGPTKVKRISTAWPPICW